MFVRVRLKRVKRAKIGCNNYPFKKKKKSEQSKTGKGSLDLNLKSSSASSVSHKEGSGSANDVISQNQPLLDIDVPSMGSTVRKGGTVEEVAKLEKFESTSNHMYTT